jgi:lantibiotic modifying enzyme
MKPLYYGATGIIWALARLRDVGALSSNRDYVPAIQSLIARHHEDLGQNPALAAYLAPAINSVQMGETGMRLVEWKLAPSPVLADLIYRGLASTIGDPRGIVWGSAGSMLAALQLFARTQESRWTDLYLRMFESLWEQMQYDNDARIWTWTHDLYGVRERRVGTLHGFAANALAMLRGRQLLVRTAENELLDRVSQTLLALALREDGFANWPASVETKGPPFVQFCNGAPGIVIALSSFPKGTSADIERLLVAAGELVWAAGPVTKLPVLCHGTAGNGYAFLKLYERTRDKVWLDRARSFAMHAIVQSERAQQKHGQRKYSLWTGDLGLTLYLWSCLQGSAEFPILDAI